MSSTDYLPPYLVNLLRYGIGPGLDSSVLGLTPAMLAPSSTGQELQSAAGPGGDGSGPNRNGAKGAGQNGGSSGGMDWMKLASQMAGRNGGTSGGGAAASWNNPDGGFTDVWGNPQGSEWVNPDANPWVNPDNIDMGGWGAGSDFGASGGDWINPDMFDGIGAWARGGGVFSKPQTRGVGKNLSVPHGLVHSNTPGRADAVKTKVPAGGYVIPADIVSGLGQGNTQAGAKMLTQAVRQAPAPSDKPMYARGGMVDVRVSGGEYYLPPHFVAALGKGNPDHGQKILDHTVVHLRRHFAERQRRLPPPKR